MRKFLTIGTIALGCCLAGVAQTGGASNQKQGANPGQTQQAVPGNSEAQSNSALQSANQRTTVQGCLSQSPEGNFTLADAAGNQYQLKGEAAHLNEFVGQEIRVDGFDSAIDSSSPGAMASKAPLTPEELQGPVSQINVSKITKIADICQASPGSKY